MGGATVTQPGPMIKPQVQGEATKYNKYPRECVLGISVTVIVLGILSVILGIIAICLYERLSLVGAGIWGGGFFILAGLFGVVSAKKTTTCWIMTVLMMSIIGAVISVGPLTTGSIAWAWFGFDYYNGGFGGNVVVDAMMVFTAVVAGILLIILSVLACCGICDTKISNKPVMVAGQVQYIPGPDGQQKMVIIPINQGASYPPGQQVVVADPQALTEHNYQPTAPLPTSFPVAPPAYEEKQLPPEYKN